jgi:hypothetical protein
MRCPFCGAANRPGMSFCCECGEPLDPEAPPAAAPPRLARQLAAQRRPAWELVIGAALIAIIAIVALADAAQETTRARLAHAYHEGQTALAAGDLPAALSAFAQAGAYKDAATLYTQLFPRVRDLSAAYDAGVAAAAQGAWWDAAHSLRQAAAIQLSYRDVLTREREAIAHAGPLFYRAPVPEGGLALWWAAADGASPRRLPSGPASEVIAGSPNGRWVVYSYGAAATAGRDREGPYLLDLSNGRIVTLAQKFRDFQGGLRARFRDDSSGFWWAYDNQAFYYDLTTTQGLPISEAPGAVDTRQGRLLLNRVLVSEDLSDPVHSRLLLSDPYGTNRTPLIDEPGEVGDISFSADGGYLLYRLVSRPPAGAPGPHVTTATVVLHDFASPEAPVRTALYTQRISEADQPAAWMRVAFAPGSHTPLALIGEGAGWTLLRWDGAAMRPLTSGAGLAADGIEAAGPGLLAFQEPSVGPGGLRLLDLASGVTGPAPGTRWAAFAADSSGALITSPSPRADTPELVTLIGPMRPADDAPAWHALPLATPKDAANAGPLFTPDGSRILGLATGAGGPGLYAMRRDGSDPILVARGVTAFWIGSPATHILGPAAEAGFLDR